MKVGTDGVLLGAWAELQGAKTALDIGAGTGLISLMLAQRFPSLRITGIESERQAQIQAAENCRNSPFAKNITILHEKLQSYQTDTPFDAVVCNPPYFEADPAAKRSARTQARHQQTLSFAALLSHTRRLLGTGGKACFIIPYLAEEAFLEIAAENQLFPYAQLRVKGSPRNRISRSLLAVSAKRTARVGADELVIENQRQSYTADFKALVEDFYLYL